MWSQIEFLVLLCLLTCLTYNQCHCKRFSWSLLSPWKRYKELATSESSRSEVNTSVSINRKDKCNCECDEDDEDAGVQLMAMEKIIKVPKIKIHDFGKKEDWDLYGKMDMDMTNPYSKGRGKKFVMRTQSMTEHEADSGWEVAGKYNFEGGNWEMDGKPGMGFDM